MGVSAEEMEAARKKTGQVDRNGFFLDEAHLEQGVDSSGMPLKLPPKALEQQRAREGKWLAMFSEWDNFMEHKAWKVKSRCRKGIPASLRGRAWEKLVRSEARMNENPGLYAKLVEASEHPMVDENESLRNYLEVVDRDLDRTFPHNDVFTDKDGDGQKMLRELLRAYVVYNTEIGYCQGMGMIAGTLLMQLPPEKAFWCMVCLLEEQLKGFFDVGLSEIQVCADVLTGLIKQHSPKLHDHLETQGVSPLLYFTDWFMCAYVKTVPWESVLRIWDMYFFEGVKVLYRVALAILLQSEKHLLDECPDTTELMMYLRDIPIDLVKPNTIIPYMMNIKVKTEDISRLHVKAVEQYKAKKHRTPDEKAEAAAAEAKQVAAEALHLVENGWKREDIQEEQQHQEQQQQNENGGVQSNEGDEQSSPGESTANENSDEPALGVVSSVDGETRSIVSL